MTRGHASLLALAEHLRPDLAAELTRLVTADSDAHKYAETLHRAERAEDLVAELRRHLDARERDVDRLRADLAARDPLPDLTPTSAPCPRCTGTMRLHAHGCPVYAAQAAARASADQ